MLRERLALAKKFYEQQNNKKFKQVDLAERVNVSKQSVGYWFGGNTKSLDGHHLFKVAEYFGVNPRWLAGEDVPITESQRINIEQTESIESDEDQLYLAKIMAKTSVEHLQVKRALENLKASIKIKIEQSDLSEEQILKIAEQLDQTAIKIIHI